MADRKKTDLTEITSAATNDIIDIVDVDNTTDDPAGSSRKIQVVNLLASVGKFPATKIVAPQNSGYTADYYTDGVADDVEINAALVAAAGGVVELIENTYLASAHILMPSNTTLRGRNRWNTIIKGANSTSIDYIIENFTQQAIAVI